MKTKIYNFIAFCFCLFFSLPLQGGSFRYKKGLFNYVVEENRTEYTVICSSNDNSSFSRNKNISDRQNRMTAIDLIGVYILFRSTDLYKSLGSAYFPLYAEGLNLHYNAYLEGFKQADGKYEGRDAVIFSCAKKNYRIESATYNTRLDIPQLLNEYYQNNKSEESAQLVYQYPQVTSEQMLTLECDFLMGLVRLPNGIRELQSLPDRFEQSVYNPSGIWNPELPNKNITPSTVPYSQFYYEEIVTAAPLKEKEKGFKEWTGLLNEKHSVYESILAFCSSRCRSPLPKEYTVLSDVIEAFPGAISPFGIRQPVNDQSYQDAAKAYSQSDFATAADILRNSIDSEGITAQNLNLLGASYRSLNHPERALPYLLLCLKYAPDTLYLAGNIFLCLKQLNYCRLDELKTFISSYAKDSWSLSQIFN